MDTSPDYSLFEQLDNEIPDIDLASFEYFSNIPFDARLEQLLDNETPEVHISLEGSTTQFLDDPLFPSNELNLVDVTLGDDEVVTFDAGKYRYSLDGTSRYDGQKVSVELNIHDGDSNICGVVVNDIPDHTDAFVAYRIDPDRPQASKVLNTKELIRYMCLLANVEPRTAENALRYIEAGVKDPDGIKLDRTIYQEYFMQLWNRLGQGDESASRSETRKIIHELDSVHETEQEVLRLQQTETETSDDTTLTTTLEYAKIYQELDIEDTYTVTLEFTKSGKENIGQSASRIVSSGADAYRLKKAVATQIIQGRETILDLNDPDIQQLFVDWFDQLVSA